MVLFGLILLVTQKRQIAKLSVSLTYILKAVNQKALQF